jgi:predicted nucleotidyltransferase
VTLLEKILRRIQSDLQAAQVEFAVVGALAVSIHTEPRFTRDADLAVSVRDDREAESLIHRLQSRGHVVRSTVEQEATGRLATVRLLPPGETASGVVTDLLFASSGIEPEIVAAAERLEVLAGVTVGVGQPGHLIAMKVLSRDDRTRPQDVIDLRALLHRASPAELELAKSSLELIQARGFHRNRDLLGDFGRLLRDFWRPRSTG